MVLNLYLKYYFKYFRRVHEDINYNTQETLTSKSTTHLMNRSVANLDINILVVRHIYLIDLYIRGCQYACTDKELKLLQQEIIAYITRVRLCLSILYVQKRIFHEAREKVKLL